MTQKDRFIFGLYALCISVLVFHLWQRNQERNAQKAQYFRFSQTLGQLYEQVERCAYFQCSAIKKSALDYPCPYNDSLLYRSRSIKERSEALKKIEYATIRVDHSRDAPDTTFPDLTLVQGKETENLAFFKMKQDFADSIRAIFPVKSPEQQTLTDFCSPERQDVANRILSGKRPNQKALLFQLSNVEQVAASVKALDYLRKAVAEYELKADAFRPNLVLNTKSCPRVGETIRGEVYAEAYSTKDENVSCTINGIMVPLQQGIARYSLVAQKPGPIPLLVRMDVKNPVTGITESFRKEFSLKVCE